MPSNSLESIDLSTLIQYIPDLEELYDKYGVNLIPKYCVENCELYTHTHIDGEEISLFVIPEVEDADKIYTVIFRSDGRCIIIEAQENITRLRDLEEEDFVSISNIYASDGRIYEARENSRYSHFEIRTASMKSVSITLGMSISVRGWR